MGNVQASAKPVTSSIIPPVPTSSPEINPESNLTELDNKTNYVKLDNPGTMEELHKKCKGFYLKQKNIKIIKEKKNITKLFFFLIFSRCNANNI